MMTNQEKALKIGLILDELFPHLEIPLIHKDPYTLLIAVLLSAQCQDARVNQVTPKLFALASTPEAMVEQSIEAIEAIIRPCGLSKNKSQAIWRLSKMLIEEHGGKVPDSLSALEKLPGVGHKTASVVLLQAFGKPAFPVDTHIHRLAKRWGLSDGSSVEKTEQALKKLFPETSWGKLHLQIIYFGRVYCPALRHDPSTCPICSWCSIE
ncbi:MAG: nth [Chlamydiales bacterium]|jgi:endonuclease-3|nr:nth [Chlamydiales bacterium]